MTHWMVLEAELKIPYKTCQEGNVLACINSMVVSVSNMSLENRRNLIVHCCKLHCLQDRSSSLNCSVQIGIFTFKFMPASPSSAYSVPFHSSSHFLEHLVTFSVYVFWCWWTYMVCAVNWFHFESTCACFSHVSQTHISHGFFSWLNMISLGNIFSGTVKTNVRKLLILYVSHFKFHIRV
jgi:hypothetical protein